MRRREFVTVLASAAAWPLHSHAQQIQRIPVVGVLWHAGSAEEEEVYLTVVRRTFGDLGYFEGKTIKLEHRFPAEDPARFESQARELSELEVDLIIAVTARAAIAAKRVTSKIPIVFVLSPDPIGSGLVTNFTRPEGNLTGLSLNAIDLSGKRLQLLKEAVGKLTSVGLLPDPIELASRSFVTASRTAAISLGIATELQEAAAPKDIGHAFSTFHRVGVDAVIVGPGPMFFNERVRIGSLALEYKLPTLVNNAEMVLHGALMSYGQDFPDFFRRAVVYADRILKGTKPGDLPIEQPTRLKLVINANAAQTLSLAIPGSLLARADEVIE
jgi:putative tryptophan/tyrosine transport system substrate-binding protein